MSNLKKRSEVELELAMEIDDDGQPYFTIPQQKISGVMPIMALENKNIARNFFYGAELCRFYGLDGTDLLKNLALAHWFDKKSYSEVIEAVEDDLLNEDLLVNFSDEIVTAVDLTFSALKSWYKQATETGRYAFVAEILKEKTR